MARMKKLLCIFVSLAIISTVFPVANATFSIQQTGTKVCIDPPSIIDTELDPGETFSVNATIANVTDLYTWQVKLYYNPEIINCTRARYPSGHVFDGQNVIPVKASIEENYVMIGMSLMGAETTFNGSGVLATFQFNVTGTGSSEIIFSRPLGEKTFLWDSNLEDMEFTAEDGFFANRPPPPPATLYVDPPRIVNPELEPCQNFALNVNILNTTQLYNFQFKLGFNPNILNATDASLGSFLPEGITSQITIDNTAGYIWFNISLHPLHTVLEGNGTLANITFHVKNLGNTDLTLYDVKLTDSTGSILLYNTSNGYFNNILEGKLAVDPTEIIDPTLLPTSTFEINITIDDVENLYGYEFTLTFDPNIIVCLNVKFHDVQNEAHYIPNLAMDNIHGAIWVNVSYYDPAEPITTYANITFITMQFRIVGVGATPLNLTDTNLVDSTGQPLTHELVHGYFRNQMNRDVAILNVTVSKTEVYVGWPLNITVTVKNKGNETETFYVTTYYSNNQTYLIGNQTIINLLPDAQINLIFTWNTTGVSPCHNYTLSAEASPVPYEINLTDNTFTDGTVNIKMLGDLNGDGVIDMKDLAPIAAAFGADPSHPRWNPEADLNRDNVIDMRDLAYCAANFGKTC